MRPNELGKRDDQQGPLKGTLSLVTADPVLQENHSAVLRRVLDHVNRASGIERPTDETRHELAAALCAIAPDAVTVAENALITYMQGSASDLSIRAMTALQSIVSPSTPMLRTSERGDLPREPCHSRRSFPGSAHAENRPTIRPVIDGYLGRSRDVMNRSAVGR